MTPTEAPTDKGAVERLLAPLADVHRGEAGSAVLMTLPAVTTEQQRLLARARRQLLAEKK